MTDLLTTPVPVSADGDHDRFAHAIKTEDHLRGYVLGEPVEALCGLVWVPSRDPKKYPVCPSCKAILEAMGEEAV